MLLELRMGNLDLDSTSYVYSMQISPIELEFDHDKAALGNTYFLALYQFSSVYLRTVCFKCGGVDSNAR